MIYREYGKTGKKVSALGFGGMRFGEVDNKEACLQSMLEAASAGVTYFDTAPGYFGGKSEERFGEAFAEFRRRGLPFYCATKTSASDEAAIRREIDAQLKRLGLETIDFYHVWCITSLKNWKERKRNGVLKAFRKLKDEGLIRHISVSSHLIGNEIKELLDEGVFEGVLFGYSAYNFNVRDAAFEAITRHRLGAVVMNPLGGGIIPQNEKLFEFVRTQKDESVVEAAIRFLLAHEQITLTLVGFRNTGDVQQALRAVEGYRAIPAAELERIRKSAGESFRDLCTGCQYCDNCPEDIPIPKLMDAYNHKRLYGNDQAILNRLNWHWSVKPAEAERCTECGQCEEACTQHLPIIERLKEIAAVGAAKKG
jgi:predicted aldo/keto reductase-like oxidoreductase